MRSIWLIARSVLIEAVRRKEIYAVVLISLLLIGALMTVDFFRLEGITKFYSEAALKVMSAATALTVIVLAARQLPREFEARTIYPLLAKPVGRVTFLLGKLLGILLAAAFCLGMFMTVYIIGIWYLKAPFHWGLWAQYVYLQMLMMLILAALSFWLSMVVNLDAAITLGVIFYGLSSILTNAVSFLYHEGELSGFGKGVLTVLNYALPHLTLFDLSEKVVHADAWEPLGGAVLGQLTLYGGFFALLYLGFGVYCFRRRPL